MWQTRLFFRRAAHATVAVLSSETFDQGDAHPYSPLRPRRGHTLSVRTRRAPEASDRGDQGVRAETSRGAVTVRRPRRGDHLPIDLREGGENDLRTPEGARHRR